MYNADRETHILIKGLDLETCAFDNFLFLRPPKTTAPTKSIARRDYICLDPEYFGKLFVNGMFITEYPPDTGLYHGYNLTGEVVRLGRDRDVPASLKELAKAIWKLWSSLILNNDDSVNKTLAIDAYLELFDRKPVPLDIMNAAKNISKDRHGTRIAQMLFDRYCADKKQLYIGKETWVYAKSIRANRNIIQELGLEPIPVEDDLYQIWETMHIVYGPTMKRRKVFLASPLNNKFVTVPYARHTKRLVDLFLQTNHITKSLTCEWRSVDPNINLDVVSDGLHVHVNARFLDITHIHPKGGVFTCTALLSIPEADPNFVCDCAAHELAARIYEETGGWDDPPKRRAAEAVRRDFAALYPRNVAVTPEDQTARPIRLRLSWMTLAGTASRDFLVCIRDGHGHRNLAAIHPKEG